MTWNNKKISENFQKRALKENSSFFDGEFPYETRTSLFSAFRILGTQILWREIEFWVKIFKEKILIRTKNYDKMNKSEPNIPCSI